MRIIQGFLVTALASLPTQIHAQAPTPQYDAVSIKPNNSPIDSTRWRTTDDGFQATNMSLPMLLATAYHTRKDLISGLPAWATSAHFDIAAKLTEDDPAALKKLTPDQRNAMLAQILTDRFHLAIHPEARQLPVYDLVLARDGSRLKPNATLPEKTFDPKNTGIPAGAFGWSDQDFNGTAVALSTLVSALAVTLERNVIDKTGLAGNFDIHLKWTPDRGASAGPDSGKSEDPAPPLFTAIEQQLGLKLVPTKGPVQTWVIDHIDHPTEN